MTLKSRKPPSSDALEQLRESASHCVKCGRCLTVCPVYIETGRETEVARGKLALIEAIAAGTMSLSEEKVKDILSYCLLCGACAENCPNLVAADEIIQAGRAAFLSSKSPSKSLKLALTHLLPYPKRMDLLHRLVKTVQPLLLKSIPQESGLHLRFPTGEGNTKRLIPPFADEPLLKTIWKKNQPDKPAVMLFVGCLANYLFPHIGQTVLTIFERMNLPVLIPSDQGCCGLMASGAGEQTTSRRVAARNIAAFEHDESVPIIAFCSSCSAHLKHYPDLFDDDASKKRALQFGSRVKDLSEFLVDERFIDKVHLKTDSADRLTFHDPCHLRRKQGIAAQPRQLLSAIEGAEFVETGQEQLCCGSGGSFNLSHYDVSLEIFKRRLAPIQEAAVDTIVTSCMGCLLQFMDGLHQEDNRVEAKHLAEILRDALR